MREVFKSTKSDGVYASLSEAGRCVYNILTKTRGGRPSSAQEHMLKSCFRVLSERDRETLSGAGFSLQP